MEENIELHKIRIAVCDDYKEERNQLSVMIRNTMSQNNNSFEIMTFKSGKELLKEIKNIDIVFLDIEMPEMDGIETGEQIRSQNPKCKIIIASGREDRMKDCFKIKALRFVSKPYRESEVEEALESYMFATGLGFSKMEVFKNRKTYWIRQRDIHYIKAYNGTVLIATEDGLFRKAVSLNRIKDNLDMRIFHQIHKGYIVGLFHVKDYSDNKVWVGKEQLPISRRCYSDFEITFSHFDTSYRR